MVPNCYPCLLFISVPQQTNGFDCGVFALRFAYNILLLRNVKFTLNDINDNFKSLITDGPIFQFGEADIARIRKEYRMLIRELSDLFHNTTQNDDDVELQSSSFATTLRDDDITLDQQQTYRARRRYENGTRFAKLFYIEDLDDTVLCHGSITGYNSNTRQYSVLYDDEDVEEVDEVDMDTLVLDGLDGTASVSRPSPTEEANGVVVLSGKIVTNGDVNLFTGKWAFDLGCRGAFE